MRIVDRLGQYRQLAVKITGTGQVHHQTAFFTFNTELLNGDFLVFTKGLVQQNGIKRSHQIFKEDVGGKLDMKGFIEGCQLLDRR